MLINVGVERGVATRMAQVVWPMMIVTVTNFEGSNYLRKCLFLPKIHIFANISELLPSEALNLSQ